MCFRIPDRMMDEKLIISGKGVTDELF